jgi:hypothetical protein
MTKNRLLGFALAAALAAGAFATSALALQGGSPDATHSYVGAMVTPDGGLCSGVLVSPTVFVTAAHCVTTDGELVQLAFDEFPGDPSSVDFAVGLAYRDPAWVAKAGGLSSSDLNDAAVVEIVAGNVPSSYAALPTVGYDDTLPNNQRVDNLGYGVQDAKTLSGAGFRQIVSEKIVPGGGATGASFLKISGGNTCFGDSGGPNLQAGTNIVLAINSYGASASCNAVSYSQRLDTEQVHRFITGFLPPSTD